MKTSTKTKVSTLKFTQLTSMKPQGMSKRFQNHFEEVHDIAYLLQCAVMVLVKMPFLLLIIPTWLKT